MAGPLHISLRYIGPDVENGTMPVDDVVDALEGFSGAYGKIASRLDPSQTHHLRVSAIRNGSFEMAIMVWAALTQTGAQIAAIETLGSSGRYIFNVLAGVIGAKKHTGGKPYNFSLKGDGSTVVIINAEGAELAVPPEALSVLRDKLIESDLNKVAAPLRPNSVESAEIVGDDDERNPIKATIGSADREYFRPESSLVTSKEMEVVGRLVSLNKENNRGTFKLNDVKNVPYRYAGDRPDDFHADFAYKGPVRIVAVAHFDENLELTGLDIKSIQRLQGELGLTDSHAH